MNVIAFDPGETTGFVVAEIDPDLSQEIKVLQSGILSMWRGAQELLFRHGAEMFIVEEFRIYPSKARTFSNSTIVPARVIGALQFLAECNEVLFVEQSSAVGKAMRIEQAVYDALGNRHAADAYRHIMAYVLSHNKGV
jgi:hypothetical protein